VVDLGSVSGSWDVVVVGAGPAGIAAASRAAESGARTLIVDQGIRPGGQIWRHTSRSQLPQAGRRWIERLERSGAHLRCGVTVVQAERTGEATLQDRAGDSVEVAAATTILATGARERFLPFPGWTFPGVVGVGGAQALLKGGAEITGMKVVMAGSGPLLLPVAAAIASAGARLTIVAEQASRNAVAAFAAGLWRYPEKLVQAAAYRARFRSARYAPGSWVLEAAGDDRLREVVLTDGRSSWRLRCDLLCTGYGLVPATELAQHLGCETRSGFVRTDPWQRTSVPKVFCAGEPTGIGGVEAALVEGEIAGASAVDRGSDAERLFARRDRLAAFARRLANAFAMREELRSLPSTDTVVCRCEDVRFGALRPDWSGRQAKLYTRVGMGPCQGRVCGPALEFLFDWTPVVVRAPVEPASVSTLSHPAARRGETSECE
jgi:D-hydroxyproline dehydrogenase subunit alpha